MDIRCQVSVNLAHQFSALPERITCLFVCFLTENVPEKKEKKKSPVTPKSKMNRKAFDKSDQQPEQFQSTSSFFFLIH